MTKRIFTLSISVAMAAATTAGTAPAQQQPATIPVPLAAALMGGAADPTRPPTRFFVGQAPDGFPAELIPPGPVSVVGGTMNAEARTVILAYPAAVENGVAAYRQFLRAQGWIAPNPTEGRTGFVSEPTATYPGMCRESSAVMIYPAAGALVGTHVRVIFMYVPGGPSPACGGPPRPPSMDRFVFPTLRAPDGVRSRGGGQGMGTSRADISTELITTMSTTALLAHYAGQLEAAGWELGPPILTDAHAVRVVSTRDPQGVEWRGILLVTVVPDGRDVFLRMTRR